jgi:hypothetical protein
VKKTPKHFDTEQTLRSELRALTEQTRKLREELKVMVQAPRSSDPTRALSTLPPPKEPRRLPAAVAHDRRRK